MAFLLNLHASFLTALSGLFHQPVLIGRMGDGMMENGMGCMMMCILGMIIALLLIVLLIVLIIYMIKKIWQ